MQNIGNFRQNEAGYMNNSDVRRVLKYQRAETFVQTKNAFVSQTGFVTVNWTAVIRQDW